MRDVWFKQEGQEHHVRMHRDMPMRPGHQVALVAVGGPRIKGKNDIELMFYNKDTNTRSILSGYPIHKPVNVLYWFACFVPIAITILIAWAVYVGTPVNKFGLFVAVFGGGFINNRLCNYIRDRRFEALLKASDEFIASVRSRMDEQRQGRLQSK